MPYYGPRVPLPARFCARCSKEFRPWRKEQRFCKETCRMAFHAKARRAEAKEEKSK